jgi:hypothetical protein
MLWSNLYRHIKAIIKWGTIFKNNDWTQQQIKLKVSRSLDFGLERDPRIRESAFIDLSLS